VARITPDTYTKIHIVDSIASIAAPTVAELAAGTEVTGFLTPAGLDTPEDGTDADISSIASARDFSIPATIGGDIQGEFYRDDTADDAWNATARLTITNLVISRFGGTGTGNAIIATDVVEVWPVRVSQRSNARITRGEALRFVATFALSADPDLAAVVAA
jgi:hypothetical protein